MSEIACVLFRHTMAWQTVGHNLPEKFLPCIDTITATLNQPSEAKASLRRFLQREFKGLVSLDFGIINCREWCIVRFKGAEALQGQSEFQTVLLGLLEHFKGPGINLESVLNLFHWPVALVNCRTGRFITSRAWQRGAEMISREQRLSLSWAVKQLCQQTPLETEMVMLDEAEGLMLMNRGHATMSAWRLMVWYGGHEYSAITCEEVPLTHAEKHVCRMLLAGYTADGIATKRGKSIHTVRTQLRNAYRKLRVTNQRELLLKLQITPQVLD